jgi:dienelactone hydrolase
MRTKRQTLLFIFLGLIIFFPSAHGFLGGPKEDLSLSDQTIDFWQPETDENFVIPSRPYDLWDYSTNIYYARLEEFKRIIPTFNGKGTLFASWTPHHRCFITANNWCPGPSYAPRNEKRPTFIILHGGHGIQPTNLTTGRTLKTVFNANVLVLDSFWSRGRFENHQSGTRLGANTRVLDVIAAVRWLEQQPEVDTNLIYLHGDSLGGQTVLRTLTDDSFIVRYLDQKIRAGFSLYPYCREAPKYGGLRNEIVGVDLILNPWMAPPLGPKYHAPVHVFTGAEDESTDINICDRSIFREATSWNHYRGATHGWDIANRGTQNPAVDGECTRAKNPHLRYRICRNDKVTNDVFEKIKAVVEKDLAEFKK